MHPMHRRIALIPLLAAVALAGCAAPPPSPASAPPPPPAAPPEPPPPLCDATGAQFAIGQPYTPELEAALRHRANAQVVRALKPGQPATMELNPTRLSVQLTARNRVKALGCG